MAQHLRGVVFGVYLLVLVACRLPAQVVTVVVPPGSTASEQLAAQDLRNTLAQIYPKNRFVTATALPPKGKAILLGLASDTLVRPQLGTEIASTAESFVIRVRSVGNREVAIIAGADSRGVAYGVYQLLARLGCGFHLDGDSLPKPKREPIDFSPWNFDNSPLVRERLVFNWHNFLSGCSTWNLADWQRWTAQAQKLGYNAIMVHAYGNNPMAGFSFQGHARAVGYLSTTATGRDWSTMHVNDVRRLFGGEVFRSPVFGADAGQVAESDRLAAAQSLMREVFADAARRSMGIYFAVDVDTPSANPQELIRLLPESARFEIPISTKAADRLWVANPDTPQGFLYYRAQVENWTRAYPHISTLVAWFRRGGTPWTELKVADLPSAWQEEYVAEIKKTPEAERYWHGPGLFAISKILRAYRQSLTDCGAKGVKLASGTWGFEFLPAADRFFPPEVPLIGLDYDVIHEKPQLGSASSRALLSEIGRRRPVIPVVWAQHDDGHYLGRSYTPLAQFSSKLAHANAAGFGIIHWTTRPLDLYFDNLAKQVWLRTKDQSLSETCRDFAASSFGESNRRVMGRYLEEWVTGAPQFARETSDRFIDRQLTNITEIIAGCRSRQGLIDQAHTTGLTTRQREQLNYYRGLEEFIAAFYEAHGCFQDAQDRLKRGDTEGARSLLKRCRPDQVIDLFARFSSSGGITRGEQGLVVSLNTRWLPHIIRLRQQLGLDPVRYKFGPTAHDPLAQSPGRFTFRFDAGHELWQTLGQAELGAAAFSLPPSVKVREELCRSGIESGIPLAIELGPILGNRINNALLPAGKYRLRLVLLDPDSAQAGQRVFNVSVSITTEKAASDGKPLSKTFSVAQNLDLFAETGGRCRVLERGCDVELANRGRVTVMLTPVRGKAVVSAMALEPR